MRVGSDVVPGYPRPARTAPVPLRDIAVAAGADAPGELPSGGARGPGGLPSGGAHGPAPYVTGVTHDSTAVCPGDLYAALPGSRRHGAEFAGAAVAAGALALLTDRRGAELAGELGVAVLVVEDPRVVLGAVAACVYGNPAARLPIIGITGTAGKTSTAYLIEAGLRAAGHVTCMIGTVETRIAGQVIDSVRTTPEATDLHALFAAALERGATAAVMEVSSHALSQGRVGGVRFAVGAFTNFGLDHLDFHDGPDDYFAAKARLFDGRSQTEILNADDPSVRRLLRPGQLTFSAANDERATWRATGIVRDGFAQSFIALGPDGIREQARVALPGRHNVANALLALACLVAVGVEPSTAAKGVAECQGVPGRLELVTAPGPVLGVVDYAHKPDAIVAALAALSEVGTGRLICVLGAGGDRDRAKRPVMGAAAVRGADIVIITDDNPRTEDPAAIRTEVLAGTRRDQAGPDQASPDQAGPDQASSGQAATAYRADAVLEVASRRHAIAEAVRLAEPGDVIAVLGKGHEVGQEANSVTTPFDDRVELAAALRARFSELPK